jgi:hypothetical protein
MAVTFRVKIDTPRWIEMVREKQYPIAAAAVAALRDVAAISVQEGRADIAAAGPNFRGNWQERLQYRTFDDNDAAGGPSMDAKAVIFHKYGIAGVFEYGATMHGRPLIWIPTTRRGSSANVFGLTSMPTRTKKGQQREIRRSRFLVSATINGQPMLFDKRDKARDRKPVYVGVKQVTVPKKFHITEIVKANWEKLAALFLLHLKDK